MSNQLTSYSPAIVSVEGKTKADRQISVVRHASSEALTACLNVKGKVGVAIRNNAARSGYTDVATSCAVGNYKSLAEMLAIRLGEPIVISSRASFESLADVFEGKIMQAKLAKNGGMREDKKTGVMVAGSKLATLMELKAIVTEIVGAVAEYHAARKAKQEAVAA